MFIGRIQLNYHLDFLTLTFISESFPNIESKLNPSFHLQSLPWCQSGEEWSDFWWGQNVTCGMRLEEPEKFLHNIKLWKKENMLSFQPTSAEKTLKWNQWVGSNENLYSNRLSLGHRDETQVYNQNDFRREKNIYMCVQLSTGSTPKIEKCTWIS